MANTKITAANIDSTSTGFTLADLTVNGDITGTLATAAQPNITSVGTLTTLSVDDITINDSTISDAGTLTIDAGIDLTLDADSGNIFLKDGGTHFGTLQNNSSDFRIVSIVQDKDLILRGNDGGTFFNALTLDMSDAGRASFNNKASFNNAIAIGQSSFSGGSVLADFHGDGNGVGSQLAFANDHNTDKFYVGIEGNTTGDAFLYQTKNADINFYTNNSYKAKLDSSGSLLVNSTSAGSSRLKVVGDASRYGILSENLSGYGAFSLKSTTVAQTWSIGAVDNSSNSDLFIYGGSSAGTKVTLDSSGEVDITGGSLKLASGANRRLFYRSANNDLILESASGLFYRQDIGNTNHSWFTGNSERMRITSSGKY